VAQASLFVLGMKLALAVVVTGIVSSTAHAETPTRYVGASASLASGYAGRGEFGFGVQVAPHKNLELEVGTLKHKVSGDENIEWHEVWLASATVRAKAPLRRGAFFAGIGVDVGEHAAENGCSSSGFIDFCGDANGTWVYRHYDRAVWIRPEFGGEVSLGPVAARFAMAPLFQLASPDVQHGCIECDDGEEGFTFTMGLHGRIPL
jgi:hypothetical protein